MKELKRLKWLIYTSRLSGNYKLSYYYFEKLQKFLVGKQVSRNAYGLSTWVSTITNVYIQNTIGSEVPYKIFIKLENNKYKYLLSEMVLVD